MLDVTKTMKILDTNYVYTEFAVKDETNHNSIYGKICDSIKEMPQETIDAMYLEPEKELPTNVKESLLSKMVSKGVNIRII